MTGPLNNLLKATSRSFYLTLRVLPGTVRPQIGLAYLLARTTDTIADTEIVPLNQRLDALAALRSRILGQNSTPLQFGALAEHQGAPAERVLLDRVEDSLALLGDLSEEDLALVRKVVDAITSGQELDLKRFAAKPPAGTPIPVTALLNDAELDDYTYRVAGCVGEFWTRMCRTHLFPKVPLNDAQLLADGVRFGKGLQLVNILRDLPRDLRQGRCYVPADRLAAAGLQPEDLIKPGNETRFRPVYDALLTLAEAHLAAGWNYTNALPSGQWRVRLACAWPILIGVKTLDKLHSGEVLTPARRIKVSRPEVRAILWRSLVRVPSAGSFRRLWQPSPSTRMGKAVDSRNNFA